MSAPNPPTPPVPPPRGGAAAGPPGLRRNEREKAMTINTVTTTLTDISLAKLIPCPANVWRAGAGSGVEMLAASIQAHGLLQSLVVRPKLDSEGQASDRYEVVAGGRRLAALKLLAKQKRITKGTAIPCRVLVTDGVDGIEASLAENIVRQDMHPADQFEAFHGLHQGGIGIEDIARLSQRGLDAGRPDCLCSDGGLGLAGAVFGQLQMWQRNPDTIRRLLTHALIPATDRKALFVGLDAYMAAGGVVQRDLFSEIGAAGLPTPPCWSGLLRSGWSGSRGEPGRRLALGWHRARSAGGRVEPEAGLAGQGGAIGRG